MWFLWFVPDVSCVNVPYPMTSYNIRRYGRNVVWALQYMWCPILTTSFSNNFLYKRRKPWSPVLSSFLSEVLEPYDFPKLLICQAKQRRAKTYSLKRRLFGSMILEVWFFFLKFKLPPNSSRFRHSLVATWISKCKSITLI